VSAEAANETIAIIGGTGDLGYGLALRWALAGVRVIVGSRELEKAQGGAARVIEQSRAAGRPLDADLVRGLANPEAAAQASVIVLAVPFPAQAAILKSIRGSLRNSFVVDATVPLAATVGGKPTRLLGVWQGSAAEQTRELVAAEIPVLSALHHVSAASLHNISNALDCDILVCGNHPVEKARLFALIRRIEGLRPVDAGPLEMARIAEGLTALLISLNRRYKVDHSGIRITGIEPSGETKS
jgi:8-hydroxy-5-deazaflavin:NADPH oxidoreductase